MSMLTIKEKELLQELDTICKSGHIKDLQLLLSGKEFEKNPKLLINMHKSALISAIDRTKLDMMQCMIQKFIDCQPDQELANEFYSYLCTACIKASKAGELDILKFLVNIQGFKLSLSSTSQWCLEHSYFEACAKGYLDIVKYFITSADLIKNVDPTSNKSVALIYACNENQLEVIKYLLESQEIKQKFDLHTYSNSPIRIACTGGYMDIVKYLFEYAHREKTTEHQAFEESAFKNACYHEKKEVIEYLIFDYKIQKTHVIESYLNVNKDLLSNVIEMFDIRDQKTAIETVTKKINTPNASVIKI